ncbi:hypothetical protein BVRB_016600 [Beta vulgaris subsp. vulgaris]|uniref:Uncharacterized protein n=1 Tax=Beta vulgaris subsp. vulgaris TaxID=3555 RepID=A0A0J8B474_BETVV|nr:hypothetical protein BVRB_016600 [Beta vulgaris subsp. vulgaris]
MAAETKIVETSIQQKLSWLPKSKGKDYRVFKVPEHLRKVNRECYEPSVVSIGPIYYKKKSLKCSQELKLRHLESFLELGDRIHGDGAYSLGDFIDFLKRLEGDARSFYEDNISLSSNEFVEMLMVDAAFIIYHIMLRSPRFPPREDPMEKMMAWAGKVEQDLFLADNQLPFFLLNDLYLMRSHSYFL